MLQEITYYLIFGKPFIMYLGLAVLLSFCVTATIQIMRLHYGYEDRIRFEWHPRMAALSFALAAFHAVLGVLAFF